MDLEASLKILSLPSWKGYFIFIIPKDKNIQINKFTTDQTKIPTVRTWERKTNCSE